MKWQENYDLAHLNTFRVSAYAKYFVEVRTVDELKKSVAEARRHELPLLILGGGSNVLFTRGFDGLVVKNSISGFEVIKEDAEYAWIKAGAGEEWHKLVLKCISLGYGGIENLSLIPGTVGAAPMQNIGAYGVEIKETFHSLEALKLDTGDLRQFDLESCDFGYRFSVFKGSARGKYVIVSVTLRLLKSPTPNTSYAALRTYLAERGIDAPTIKEASDAVIAIRQSKLPDPERLGNAGSFFKNPVVGENRLSDIKKKHPGIPAYPVEGGYKIPAAWLIEKCGWKGRRFGDAGVHEKHALILVNYGGATGAEIKKMADQIMESVRREFGVELEPEVNII